MSDRQEAEALHKVMLLNFISITAITFIVPLGIVAYVQGNPGLGFADHLVALIVLLNFLYLRKSANYALASFTGVAVIIVLYFYLLATGGVNQTAYLWYYTFPLGSSFLLGSKKGAVATMILLLLAIIFFAVDSDSPFFVHYSKDFIIRFVPSFIVVFIFSYGFEYFRETAVAKLTDKNNELNRTVKELQETGAKLRISQEGLEKRVQERTAELSKINVNLKQEIEVRECAEHERRQLRSSLICARWKRLAHWRAASRMTSITF